MTGFPALDQLPNRPFCLIRREGEDFVWCFTGAVERLDLLEQIKLTPKTRAKGQENYASINLLPFSQVRERGFAAHGDNETIASLVIDHTSHIPATDIIAHFSGEPVALADKGAFGESDADYARLVQDVIDEDIGNGEGANFVISALVSRSNRRFLRAQGACRLRQSAARRARHLLDVHFLRRRIFPGRRDSRAACIAAQWLGQDESDQRYAAQSRHEPRAS